MAENRLRRAATSNMSGWEEIGEACKRGWEETPLPWSVRRLRAVTTADNWPAGDGEAAREAFVEHVRDAELVLDHAAHFRGQPERFGEWVEEGGS
ncbi:MAG: hypothetical protein ACRDZO_14270 [Egibacteraceae bacterium]